MIKTEWILCLVCSNQTRDRIRKDTVLKNYPLYCPKCKQETLIEIVIYQRRYLYPLIYSNIMSAILSIDRPLVSMEFSNDEKYGNDFKLTSSHSSVLHSQFLSFVQRLSRFALSHISVTLFTSICRFEIPSIIL